MEGEIDQQRISNSVLPTQIIAGAYFRLLGSFHISTRHIPLIRNPRAVKIRLNRASIRFPLT